MKLLWAVSALLLSCWRANASTGKNFMSAMLVENVDFALFTDIKHCHSWSCVVKVKVVDVMFFDIDYRCH